jgi:hypothetical protein
MSNPRLTCSTKQHWPSPSLQLRKTENVRACVQQLIVVTCMQLQCERVCVCTLEIVVYKASNVDQVAQYKSH